MVAHYEKRLQSLWATKHISMLSISIYVKYFKKWKAAKDVWKVYREIEHINPIYSAICFIGYAINAIIKRL